MQQQGRRALPFSPPWQCRTRGYSTQGISCYALANAAYIPWPHRGFTVPMNGLMHYITLRVVMHALLIIPEERL